MRVRRFHSSAAVVVLWLIVLIGQTIAFAQEGTLERSEIASPALENLIDDPTTRPFYIYLPPGYQTGEDYYPTVYVLHGFFGNAESMTNIVLTIDSMIQSGDIGEMIFVFPDGSNHFNGSMYATSETIGDYETYIETDLVNHIDANYRTIAHRRSRGITGFSMGGWGSMRFAVKYPETFSVVVAQAGAYDLDSEWWQGLSTSAASANPQDWAEYNQVFAFSQFVFALSAAANPNPANPPFFLDRTHEIVDGQVEVDPERWQRMLGMDTVNGFLDDYLSQPVQLEAIKLVHGTTDGVVPVSQAQRMDAVLTERNVDHVYVEHGGEHIFIPEESLQFMSDNLDFELLPGVTNTRPMTWGQLKEDSALWEAMGQLIWQ